MNAGHCVQRVDRGEFAGETRVDRRDRPCILLSLRDPDKQVETVREFAVIISELPSLTLRVSVDGLPTRSVSEGP